MSFRNACNPSGSETALTKRATDSHFRMKFFHPYNKFSGPEPFVDYFKAGLDVLIEEDKRGVPNPTGRRVSPPSRLCCTRSIPWATPSGSPGVSILPVISGRSTLPRNWNENDHA